MADLNEVRMTGVVADFRGKGDAVYQSNIDDEKKAFCSLKLSVQRSHRKEDGSYENVNDVFTFKAFGKTAQRVVKMAKPGTGLIIKARVAPSQKLVKNGQDVLDANGKAIYSGESLIIDSYDGINFVRDYSQKNGNSQGSVQQNQVQASDPFAQAPAQQQAPQNGGFNFGGGNGAPAGGFPF